MVRRASLIAGARYMALGMEFAGIVVAGIFLGYQIDMRLGSAPWFMLLLTLGGFYGALRRLLWSLKRHSSAGHE